MGANTTTVLIDVDPTDRAHLYLGDYSLIQARG
jgi:hypothetical protein